MKSFDYHQDHSRMGPGKFLFGLTLVLCVLAYANRHQQKILLALLALLIISHLLYWLTRPLFVLLSSRWIDLSEKISQFISPLFLTLLYFLVITPYAYFARALMSKETTGWKDAQYPIKFKEPF